MAVVVWGEGERVHSLQLKCMCSRPWATIYNGVLSMESRHGGEFHTNAVALAMLFPLMELSADVDFSTPAYANLILLPVGVRVKLFRDHHTRQEVAGLGLICHVRECNRPWAYVYQNRLIVDAWHWREDHRNEIELYTLKRCVPPIQTVRKALAISVG